MIAFSFYYIPARAEDTTLPVIFNCPNDITITAETGHNSAMVVWQEPTAIDNTGEPVSGLRTNLSGERFPLGTTSIEYIFADDSRNEATCSFDITVVRKYLLYIYLICITNMRPSISGNYWKSSGLAVLLDYCIMLVMWKFRQFIGLPYFVSDAKSLAVYRTAIYCEQWCEKLGSFIGLPLS